MTANARIIETHTLKLRDNLALSRDFCGSVNRGEYLPKEKYEVFCTLIALAATASTFTDTPANNSPPMEGSVPTGIDVVNSGATFGVTVSATDSDTWIHNAQEVVKPSITHYMTIIAINSGQDQTGLVLNSYSNGTYTYTEAIKALTLEPGAPDEIRTDYYDAVDGNPYEVLNDGVLHFGHIVQIKAPAPVPNGGGGI